MKDRHTSPVHFHLDRDADGKFSVRVAAFPSCYLPDLKTSEAFLGEFMTWLEGDLTRRADLTPPARQRRPGRGQYSRARQRTAAATSQPGLPASGDRVEAVLVDDPKGKGRRFAKHAPSDLVGNIQNPDAVPPDKSIGDTLTVVVASVSSDGRQIQFRYPTPADDKPKKKRQDRGRGPGRAGGSGRRR